MKTFIAAAVLGLLVAGCGGTDQVNAPMSPSPAWSRNTAAPTTTAAPSTSMPPSVPDLPSTFASFAPATGASRATWKLVALGDSNVAGYGVRSDEAYTPTEAFPGVYARMLADQQHVTVAFSAYYPDQSYNDIRRLADWVQLLQKAPTMRADLQQADIVVVLIGFHDVVAPLALGSCPGAAAVLISCLRKATAAMPAGFARLYAQIDRLVPAHARVLVSDYMGLGPIYDRWRSDPAWPRLRAVAWDGWHAALVAAATDAGFTVIHTSTVMSNPDLSPRRPVTEVTTDGMHFNANGHRLLAGAFVAEDRIPDE